MLITAPYIVGDIGINFNCDMQIIKRLIDACFACGWGCAKFQKRTPDLCVPEKQKYQVKETPWGTMTYLEYKYKMELGKEEYDYIDKYCKEKPISWSASVWDIPSLEFLMQYDVPFIKIPSAKLTDLELIKKCMGTWKTIIISTGMSTMKEIDDAVNLLRSRSNDFVVLHTNSSYPAPINELNLNMILTLKERYGNLVQVGYSGHEQSLEPSVVAVALGAKVIERHITVSHDLWGTDQAASLEIMAMDMLKKRIDEICLAMGDGIKKITDEELKMREKLRGEN